MTVDDGAIVLRPSEGRSIDLGGFAMCVKASAGETGGALAGAVGAIAGLVSERYR